MPGITQPATSTVGALLRLIEQEKSKAPHLQTPGSNASSPARNTAQAPLENPILPESPGSERTVGVKPETISGSSEAGISADNVPGRTTVGAIGGIEGGMGAAVGGVPTPQEPKVQPTLGEYTSQGKTADQWYAETGQQSTLDSLRSDPRTNVDNITGEITRVGEERHPSHLRTINAGGGQSQPTLQEYLDRGKTRAQWYGETGQQGTLDKLGGPDNLRPLPPKTNAVTPTSALSQSLTPSGIARPTQAAQGQVLGASVEPGSEAYNQAYANLSPEAQQIIKQSNQTIGDVGGIKDDLSRQRDELQKTLDILEQTTQSGALNVSETEKRAIDSMKERLKAYVKR